VIFSGESGIEDCLSKTIMCERSPDMYLKKTVALLFALTLVCCSALAQSTPPAAQPPAVGQTPPATANAVAPGSSASTVDDTLPVQTFHSRSDEVNVIFTVTDKHN
jgi:hypothetical protein